MLTVLLQAQGGAGGTSSILMWVLIFVVMIVFMIVPQMRRQKEVKKFRENMKVGDRVVTAGGIYGYVKEIKETALLIEIAKGVEIKVDKGSVFATAQESQAK